MIERPQFDQKFKGIPLSPGCASARVCMFDPAHHHSASQRKIEPGQAGDEEARVRSAIVEVAGQLDEIRLRVEREIGKAEAGIFAAQKAILEDTGLEDRIIQAIRTLNLDAESAVSEALNFYESKLLAFDNEYMKERATDFGELRRRLADVLTGMKPIFQCSEGGCRRGHNRIVVTSELTPYLTMELDTGHVLGFVSERGGPTSHAAILARALGIPAVSGIPGFRSRVHCGAELLVNGDTGEVVLWPSEATLAQYRAGRGAEIRAPAPEAPVPGVVVMANINMPSEVPFVLEMLGEGIGLYRTEFELMVSEGPLSEETLAQRYSSVVRDMGGRPVVFRMFDIGSDKPLPSLSIDSEDNPALGLRGARLLLRHRDLVRIQARALAAASVFGEVRVMYPMIVSAEQFLQLREEFENSIRGLTAGRIIHGAMLEVPSACLDADEILKEAEFASIGTNDLAQYTFAADRNNALVSGDLDPEHRSFRRLIKMLADAASARGRELSVCGEIAGNLRHVNSLIDLGIRTLSVDPLRIPILRQHIRQRREAAAGNGKRG